MNGTRVLLKASDSTRKREVVDVPMEGTTEGRRNGKESRREIERDAKMMKKMSESKRREIGEDVIVERKVVAERRSGRACS
jgi:hypothetical protein